jgi:predicted GNAT family N-acyltransferase
MPLPTGTRPEPIVVRIEPLVSSHERGAFTCKSTPKIQNYCRNNAWKEHDLYKVRVYVAVLPSTKKVVGFYSLVLTSLNPKKVSQAAKDKFARVEAVPAIYLGMIGVSDECAGGKVGAELLRDAIEKSLQISEIAGAYALALDALDEEVAELYAKFDFEPFVEGELKMFLALNVARDAASAS